MDSIAPPRSHKLKTFVVPTPMYRGATEATQGRSFPYQVAAGILVEAATSPSKTIEVRLCGVNIKKRQEADRDKERRDVGTKKEEMWGLVL